MTVGSLFAGIGGFDLAAEQAGMRVVWQSEIEPFCRTVLTTDVCSPSSPTTPPPGKGPSEARIVARFGDDGQAFDADGVRDASGVPEGMDDPAGMDAPRYKALGNAVTVNTVRWILGRIAAVEKV